MNRLLVLFIVTTSCVLGHSRYAETNDYHVSEEYCTCPDSVSAASWKNSNYVFQSIYPERNPEVCGYTYINASEEKSFPWDSLLPALSVAFYKDCGVLENGKWVIHFDDVIRIGDDTNYNEHHVPEHFCISTAKKTFYSASFTIPEKCRFDYATLNYYATGVYGDNTIRINDKLVDTTCHTGNVAGMGYCCSHGEVPITKVLRHNKNTIRIDTVLYPHDDVTPHDDIELYSLHITMTPHWSN